MEEDDGFENVYRLGFVSFFTDISSEMVFSILPARAAVASACARNPVGILGPCHRVLRKDGGLGGYRWGLPLKERLLGHESH